MQPAVDFRFHADRRECRSLPKPQIVSAQVSVESDRSFASYDQAFAHVNGARLADNIDLYWDQAMLDVLLDYPIASDRSDFSIHPGYERLGLRVITVFRFLPPGGAVRAFEFTGDPGLVRLDPRWHQAALRFVELGFWHILEGTDHLLFLFCLVIPFRRLRPLITIVTSFTIAHSITLIASALHLGPDALWFPPLIETLIATSILYMALENIVGSNTGRRWIIAFGFGLVHGFGFSFALQQTLQFAGAHCSRHCCPSTSGSRLDSCWCFSYSFPRLNWSFVMWWKSGWDHHPFNACRPHSMALDGRSRRPAAAVSIRMAGAHSGFHAHPCTLGYRRRLGGRFGLAGLAATRKTGDRHRILTGLKGAK